VNGFAGDDVACAACTERVWFASGARCVHEVPAAGSTATTYAFQDACCDAEFPNDDCLFVV